MTAKQVFQQFPFCSVEDGFIINVPLGASFLVGSNFNSDADCCTSKGRAFADSRTMEKSHVYLLPRHLLQNLFVQEAAAQTNP